MSELGSAFQALVRNLIFTPPPWCHPSAVFLEDPSRSQPEVGVPDLVGSK